MYRTPSQVPSSSDEDEDNRMNIDSDDSDNDGNRTPGKFPSNKRKSKSASIGVTALDYQAFSNLLDQSTPNQSPLDPVTTLSSDDDGDIIDSSGNEEDDDTDDGGHLTPTPSKNSKHSNESNTTASPNPPTEKAPFDLHSKTSNNNKGIKRGYGLGMTRKRSKF